MPSIQWCSVMSSLRNVWLLIGLIGGCEVQLLLWAPSERAFRAALDWYVASLVLGELVVLSLAAEKAVRSHVNFDEWCDVSSGKAASHELCHALQVVWISKAALTLFCIAAFGARPRSARPPHPLPSQPIGPNAQAMWAWALLPKRAGAVARVTRTAATPDAGLRSALYAKKQHAKRQKD